MLFDHNQELKPGEFERPEHRRRPRLRIDGPQEVWTLEGDRTVFLEEPQPTVPIELVLGGKSPSCRLTGPLFAHVWINRARAPLQDAVPVNPDGQVALLTYPGVVTSVKFRDQQGRWEAVDRHPVPPSTAGDRLRRFVVLGRAPLLAQPPPADLFEDPPFRIRRPGAYEDEGHLHFVVHAPDAARIDLTGDWLGNQAVPMQSTMDESYWWTRVPPQQILAGLGSPTYHGARYRFLFDETEPLQDPAAGWVESSWNQAFSRLVQTDHFTWNDALLAASGLGVPHRLSVAREPILESFSGRSAVPAYRPRNRQ
jgi:hypothetical protein